MAVKNSMGKTRPADKPYLVYTGSGWTWKVLKAYSGDPLKVGARWLCVVSSPFTDADWGDTYVADVVSGGTLAFTDPVVDPANVPDPAKVPASPMAGW